MAKESREYAKCPPWCWGFSPEGKAEIYHSGDLVVVRYPAAYLEPPEVEFVGHLRDLEVVFSYIRDQFPSGWQIQDGQIIPAKSHLVEEGEI